MRVRDIVRGKRRSGVITVRSSDDIATAVELLMDHTIGGLPVVSSEGRLLGFVSERDIVRAVHRHVGSIRGIAVETIMSRPAPTCRMHDTLREVMARMTGERHRHLVVLDGDRIEGILSVGDLVKDRIEQLELETGVLRDYLAGQRARR